MIFAGSLYLLPYKCRKQRLPAKHPMNYYYFCVVKHTLSMS